MEINEFEEAQIERPATLKAARLQDRWEWRWGTWTWTPAELAMLTSATSKAAMIEWNAEIADNMTLLADIGNVESGEAAGSLGMAMGAPAGIAGSDVGRPGGPGQKWRCCTRAGNGDSGRQVGCRVD